MNPRALFFNVTHRCNLNCKHCAVLSGSYCLCRNTSSELTLEEIDDVAEQFATLGGMQVYLAGGEPLLRKDIFDIVKLFSEKGIFTLLETNSTLMTRHIAKSLKDSGLNQISTSIDGTANTHNSLRGRADAFEKAVKGIRNAKEEGIHVEINSTIHRGNYDEVAEIAKLASNLHCPLRFTPLTLMGRAKNMEDQMITPQQLIKLIEFGSELKKEGYMVSVNVPPALLRLNLIPEGTECGWGEFLCGLFPDGTVSICPITTEYPEFHAGNIRSQSLKEIWERSPVFKMFRKLRRNIAEELKGVCGICAIRDLCKGSCRVAAYAKYGDLAAPFPLCQYMYESGCFPKQLLES